MQTLISLMVTASLLLLGCFPSTGINLKENSVKMEPHEIVQEEGQKLPIEAQAKIGTAVIELEVAKTQEQQSMGLMYRKSLEDNKGMIFLFDQPRFVRFWMKNVTLSLDMIFLRDGVVKAVLAQVPPCPVDPCPTYGPDTEIDQVIELRGGHAKELGITEGDSLEIKFLESSQ